MFFDHDTKICRYLQVTLADQNKKEKALGLVADSRGMGVHYAKLATHAFSFNLSFYEFYHPIVILMLT